MFVLDSGCPEPIKAKFSQLADRFTFSQRSDRGGSGFVFFGVQTATQRQVAVKFYSLRDSANEALDLASINSTNVIQVLDAGPVDHDWAYFVTPRCEGGDFEHFNVSDTVTQRDALKAVSEVLSGVSHLHSTGLVHRDLKPSNVFLDSDGQAIIGDLGSIRRLPTGATLVTGSAKTLFYVPPEVIANGAYSTRSDLYQIGLLLFRFSGGSFAHEIAPWLDEKTRRTIESERDPVARTRLENDAVLGRVVTGRAVDLLTLPPFTPPRLTRVIRKSVSPDDSRRYASASAFLNDLSIARSETFPWVKRGSNFVLLAGRVKDVSIEVGGRYVVRAKNDRGWRKVTGGPFAAVEEAFRFAEQAR